MKKRIISLVCLIILCMSLTVPAMATEGTPNYSIRSQHVWIEEPLTLYEDPRTSGRRSYWFDDLYDFEYTGYNLVHEDSTITLTNNDSGGTMFLRIYFHLNNGDGKYFMTSEHYDVIGESWVRHTKDSRFYVDENGEIVCHTTQPLKLAAGQKISVPVSQLIEKASDLGTEDAYFCLIPIWQAEGSTETESFYEYIYRVDNEQYVKLKGSAPNQDGSKEQTPPEEGNPFADVPEDAYYHDAVLWAYENGVTSGTSATTFSPDATCTRGQVVTFLWRACGSPEPSTTTNPFADVSESDYFYKAVLWAVEKGITAGTSATTFSPAATCTSGQVVTFLWRANGSPAATTEATEYYAEAVDWARTSNLFEGTSVTFDPKNACPRADIVTYIYRATAK